MIKGCAECGVGGGYALYCLACAEKYVKPEWVGLTDKELEEFSEAKIGSYDLCLEVEAKLKEKNHVVSGA